MASPQQGFSKGTIDIGRRENSSFVFFATGKKNAAYRLMGNAIIAGNLTQRFLVLQNTALHRGPLRWRNAMFWFRWTWPSSCSSEKRGISIGMKLSENLLKLLVEVT